MRTLTGTSGEINIADGDGVAGNPTFSLANTAVTPGTYNTVTVDAKGRVTSASNVVTGGSVVTVTNGEASTIAIGSAVYVSSSGVVELANANSGTTKNVAGLVYGGSINSGASGSVAVNGSIVATTGQWDAITSQTGGLTAGAIYYLSNVTDGALTTTAPTTGYICPIGLGLSTTTMLININQSIKL